MSEKFTPNNFENDEHTENISDIDYKNLINKLMEIKTNITLLEENILS